ncbi:MAG: VOC family protein [Myxococcota bacterium]|nr:VOC family protein [Myxococcota bacterium]
MSEDIPIADRHRAQPNQGRAGAISPAKLAHVVLRTAKFEEARQWYITVLGAEVIAESPLLVFLTYDDEHHRIALLNDPNAAPGGALTQPRTTGLEHVSFTYAGLGDLLLTYERLAKSGIEPHWCVNHGATTSMYFLDPDGNQVELQVDAFDSLEETLRDGPPIGEIGVEFDPEDLLARYRAGVPARELLKQDPTRGRDHRPGRRATP